MDFWLGLFFSAQWLLCLWWWHFCGGLANKQSIDTVSILVFWSHQVNKLEPWHIVHIMKQLNRHSIDRLQLPWLTVSVGNPLFVSQDTPFNQRVLHTFSEKTIVTNGPFIKLNDTLVIHNLLFSTQVPAGQCRYLTVRNSIQ